MKYSSDLLTMTPLVFSLVIISLMKYSKIHHYSAYSENILQYMHETIQTQSTQLAIVTKL